MRSPALSLIASLVLAAGCTVRPPPIKSPPTAQDPAGAPACTMSDGIDASGHPACSEGCTWSVAEKQCGPEAPPPVKVPPNGA